MKRKVCLVVFVVALALLIAVGFFFLRTPLVSKPDLVRQTYFNTAPFDDWDYLFHSTAGKPWLGKIKAFDLEIDSTGVPNGARGS